jgi:predicted permease
MTKPRSRVPLALRLAARLLPSEVRDEVLGDLYEAWLARRRTHTRGSLALWTLRQPLAALRVRFETRERAGPSLLRRGPWFAFSWIDVKLGVRMLSKQPVLTVVAGLTLAIGIPTALGLTHIMFAYQADLPVDDGDRIVGLRYWDVESDLPHTQLIRDLAVWRERLGSVEDMGAVTSAPRNVRTATGSVGEVMGSEVTASVFDLLRMPPLIGRTLVAADEVDGAPDVVVISEDLWESRLGRDPDVIGRTIGIGSRTSTVVGVMPAGFYFPRFNHLWLPLRADPDDYAAGSGPELLVAGRLADRVSKSRAEAELRTVEAALAMEWPERYRSLRAEVVPFHVLAMGWPAGGVSAQWEFRLAELLCFALLAVVCGNIGTLFLARTAMRMNELSVRTALGASRLRILSQLFVEALVLSLGATGAGLALAQLALIRGMKGMAAGSLPYWVDLDLGPHSVLLALAVGTGCAVIAGVLPAVKATSPRIQRNLQGNSRGATLRFGPVTSFLIVTEVALSVGFLGLGAAAARSYTPYLRGQADFDMDRYLLASLSTPRVDPAEEGGEGAERYRLRAAESNDGLRDRLQAHPSVVRVAMGLSLPGVGLPERRIQLERGREARTLTGDVHVDYFRDLGLRVLQGRTFTGDDVEGGPDAYRPVIVVNDQFVDQVLGGGDAVGQRVAYVGERAGVPSESYEIIGVVETFGTNVVDPDHRAAIYRPFASGDRRPTMGYVIEVAGDATDFIPRLREIAAAVDPEAIVQRPESVAGYVMRTRGDDVLFSIALVALSLVGMLLAATGLYALVSVTVSQRTKEIGIRTALGAGAGDVVVTIARRAFLQLLAGVALGSLFGGVVLRQVMQNDVNFAGTSIPGMFGGVAAAVTLLTTLACLAPTLRGLRIQPTEALGET